jgi:hypothetical protein
MAAITRPNFSPGAAWTSTAWPTGMTMPAPSPCSTLKPIRLPGDQASPHNTEPTRKMAIDVIQTVRAPNRSSAHPASGIVAAIASRYPVVTHWMVVSVDPKSRTSVRVAMVVTDHAGVPVAPDDLVTAFPSSGDCCDPSLSSGRLGRP